MAWRTNSKHEKELSEINITPLTDVMLVLLVIFMVTTPLIMNESLKIKLPKATTSESGGAKGVIVTVSEAGLISVNGKGTNIDGLYDALKREFVAGAENTVVLKADEGVRYKVVVKALDIARLAGATALSMNTLGLKKPFRHQNAKKTSLCCGVWTKYDFPLQL
ncbi:MAG: biopolymer transporter ExbD [Deltaproteobacteria bacterium]|nr:biopolymer transporter ExbD [Deltaproteobacteria bacterium]